MVPVNLQLSASVLIATTKFNRLYFASCLFFANYFSFKPETFYRLEAGIASKSGESRKFTWKHGRVFEKKSIVAQQNEISKEKWAKVKKMSSERKSRSRPLALNTVEMLKHGSSALGISPNDCVGLPGTGTF